MPALQVLLRPISEVGRWKGRAGGRREVPPRNYGRSRGAREPGMVSPPRACTAMPLQTGRVVRGQGWGTGEHRAGETNNDVKNIRQFAPSYWTPRPARWRLPRFEESSGPVDNQAVAGTPAPFRIADKYAAADEFADVLQGGAWETLAIRALRTIVRLPPA